jgi:3-methyladenine DNA glycosylase Mpg
MTLFSQSHKQLAKSLTGKKIRVGEIEAEILKAEGYSRRENEAPTYAPVLKMKPGSVYCPRHRGGLLVLIACNDGESPGGCVLIRKVSIDGTTHNGPGRVAQALGIDESKTEGRLKESNGTLTLHI